MKHNLPILILLFSTINCLGQGSKPNDSLFHRKIVELLKNKNFKEVVTEGAKFSLKYESRYDALVQNNLGVAYTQLGKYDSAQKRYWNAHLIYNRLGMTFHKAQSLLNLATTYKTIGLYEEAILQLRTARTLFESIDTKSQRELAICNNLLGNLFRELGDGPRAISLCKTALEIYQGIDYQPGIYSAYNNLGNAYESISQLDSALTYFELYKIGAYLNNDSNRIGRSHENLARIYLKTKQEQEALLNINTSYRHFRNEPIERVTLDLIKSKYLLMTGKIDSARNLGLRVLDEAKLQGMVPEELETLEFLNKLMKLSGNHKAQLIYLEGFHNLRNSILGKKKLARIHSQEIAYAVKLKNKEIQKLEVNASLMEEVIRIKNSQKNLLIGFLIAILGLLYFIFRRYLEKRKFVEDYFSSTEGLILKTGKKIEFSKLYMIQPMRNDLILFTDEGEVIEKRTTLTQFYSSLPLIDFGRPQQSTIVNFSALEEVRKTYIQIMNQRISISPKYKEEFLSAWRNFKSLH